MSWYIPGGRVRPAASLDWSDRKCDVCGVPPTYASGNTLYCERCRPTHSGADVTIRGIRTSAMDVSGVLNR